MTKRPVESLKEAANQLAHLIVTGNNDKEKIQALEEQLGITTTSAARDQRAEQQKDEAAGHRRIGIWTPEITGGKKRYVRDEKYKREFNDWARLREIPPKSTKKRVVYLGESAARGCLLDPFYTPAKTLETLLNTKPGLMEAEVIDLARNDCLMPQLKELYTTGYDLEPDMMVIFAGNNWVKSFEITDELVTEMMEVMETEERFSGLQRILEKKYREVIAEFMRHVSALSRQNRVPVLFIIPEFNLQDCRSNTVQQINLWPRGETGRWQEIKKQVEEAQAKGDHHRAEELSAQLISLNEGNPLGYEYMAAAKLKREQNREAADYLRKAVDTAMFRLVNVPCTISVVRQTLKEEAERNEMPVVDLPEVFSRSQGGQLPGRELFLDYCHLTEKGIQITAVETAQRIYTILAETEVPRAELETAVPAAAPEVVARSHFFAALHNSHRSEQSYEILYYHSLEALKASPAVQDLMLQYVEMATRHTVWALTKNCEKLYESGEMEQFPNILQPHNHYLMDLELVEAMTDALKTAGIDVKDTIAELRKKEHGFVTDKIDLLEPYYHLRSYVANYRSEGSNYKAFEGRSRFTPVFEKNGDLRLNVTYRIPGGQDQPDQNVTVEVNGTPAAKLPATGKWNTETLELPEKLLEDGVNTITVQWPLNIDYTKNPGKQIKEKIQAGSSPLQYLNRLLSPLYGEIDQITIRKANQKENDKLSRFTDNLEIE